MTDRPLGSGPPRPAEEAEADPGESRTASSSVLELVLPGRRSIPLRFVASQARLFVTASPPGAAWPEEALALGAVGVRLPGRPLTSFHVERLREAHREGEVRHLLRAQLGPVLYQTHFADSGPVLELSPSGIDPVVSTFDAAAAGYRNGVLGKPIERYLKNRSASLLLERLRGLDPLIEIGPGSGIETLPMLADGHSVVAIDLSRAMLHELKHAAASAGLSGRLTLSMGRLGRIHEALRDYPANYFAGGFSTFGAFNLEADLRGPARSLAYHMRPGGRLLLVVLNHPGLVPLVGELILGNLAGGWARINDRVPAGAIRYPLDIYAPGSRSFERSFVPWFRLEALTPVSVLAPPFESPRLMRFLGPRRTARLERLDGRLVSLPGAALLAEWLLYDLRRTPTSAPRPSD